MAGILFKFALDKHKIYGSDNNAAKVAGIINIINNCKLIFTVIIRT